MRRGVWGRFQRATTVQWNTSQFSALNSERLALASKKADPLASESGRFGKSGKGWKTEKKERRGSSAAPCWGNAGYLRFAE